jgi:predicted O-methyltransferase YrrM
MLKRMMPAVIAVVLLAVVGNLIAQKGDNEPDIMRTQRQHRTIDRPDGDTLTDQQRPPIPGSEQEKKILKVLEDMCQDQYSEMLSVPPEDGRVLRLLTEAIGAKHVVEIGTSNGYAAIWFCLALRTTSGKLTTYEIDTQRASLARENFKRAGVDKLVTLIEGDAHKTVTKLKEPIDIVFIDADKDGYLDYLNKLLPLVRPGGLVLAHNTTNVASQMQDYLKAITTNPDLETIFLHKQDSGIGVTLKKRQSK